MIAISPDILYDRWNDYRSNEKTMEEVDAELQAHAKEREEKIKLADFHSSGQYVGNDGKLYHMTAEYTEDATNVYPKVKVTVTDESGNVSEYVIDITKVDTGNATAVEMFALCSHADTKRGNHGDISEDTLSSWESLLFYRDMAAQEEDPEIAWEEKFNWRDMVGSVAETYMDDGAYDQYLNVNRMKDMLDYYSRFEERPDAFGDAFHAIRDYEFIRVLSLDNGINVEIYDKQKMIVCKDLRKDYNGFSKILWCGSLTDDELEMAISIACNSAYRAYMGDYVFWDSLLSGEARLEDYDTYIQELKKQYQHDHMFDNCPSQVKEAWKRAEEETGFRGLGIEKGSMEIEFISEYMRLLTERMQEGMGTDLLETTVESAIEMTKQIFDRLEEMDYEQMSVEDRRLKLRERNFYYHFLENLDPAQKFDPVELLLRTEYVKTA